MEPLHPLKTNNVTPIEFGVLLKLLLSSLSVAYSDLNIVQKSTPSIQPFGRVMW